MSMVTIELPARERPTPIEPPAAIFDDHRLAARRGYAPLRPSIRRVGTNNECDALALCASAAPKIVNTTQRQTFFMIAPGKRAHGDDRPPLPETIRARTIARLCHSPRAPSLLRRDGLRLNRLRHALAGIQYVGASPARAGLVSRRSLRTPADFVLSVVSVSRLNKRHCG